METAAGVVLAGGRSSRMGTAKADLAWHGSTLLYRTAALLRRTVDGPVVVVRAPGQRLPALPDGVRVAADPVEGRGPLQGIAAGLAAVADHPTAFVCSTDLPFLHPAFVRRVLASFTDDVDVVLPVARGFRQPLAAGYRTSLVRLIEELLAGGDTGPGMLLRHCRVARLDEPALLADPDLARLDPDLDSLVNVNEPDDYAEALHRPAPRVTVPGLGPVRAATLGAAAAAAGRTSPRARVNGVPVAPDPRLPLAAGDSVAFD